MTPQRVIRSGSRRSTGGAGSLLRTAAAAALTVIVAVLVLVAITLAVLLIARFELGHLFPVVAVEWLVLHHAPITIDGVELGYLPLFPVLIYMAVLARQTRSVLRDIVELELRDVAAALAGVVVASLLFTGLAVAVVGSAQSEFAVREHSILSTMLWVAAVSLSAAGLGAWFHCRTGLRPHLPDWFRGGLHLGTAYLAATWALGTVVVIACVLGAWSSVGEALTIGKTGWGIAGLAAISIGYLPNMILAAATVALGGEAHIGDASFSIFAVSRGPLPEVPLAAALPTTDPLWVIQGLLVCTVVAIIVLVRTVARWFATIGEGLRAAVFAASIAAGGTALVSLLAGGDLGAIGSAGTGTLIATGLAFLLFSVIGSVTMVLALAGLTRRRERERLERERRRRRLERANRQQSGRTAAAATEPTSDEPTELDTATTAAGDHSDDQELTAAAHAATTDEAHDDHTISTDEIDPAEGRAPKAKPTLVAVDGHAAHDERDLAGTDGSTESTAGDEATTTGDENTGEEPDAPEDSAETTEKPDH